MSYEIEFKRHVLTFPRGRDHSAGPLYLGIAERGSNNLVEDSGRIAREYAAVAFTDRVKFIREITRMAGFCEGGDLRCSGNRTTPEGYIKAWRNAMQQAVSIDSYLSFGGLRLAVRPSAQTLLQECIDQGKAKSANGLKRYVQLLDRLSHAEGIKETSWRNPVHDQETTATEFQLSLANKSKTIECLLELVDLAPSPLRVSCRGFDAVSWSLARSRDNAAAETSSVA